MVGGCIVFDADTGASGIVSLVQLFPTNLHGCWRQSPKPLAQTKKFDPFHRMQMHGWRADAGLSQDSLSQPLTTHASATIIARYSDLTVVE